MRAEPANARAGAAVRRGRWVCGVLVAALCGSAWPADLAPLADADRPDSAWHRVGLPRQHKPSTRYAVVTLDGERVLEVEADNSYGNLVHAWPADAPAPHHLAWRWRVDQPNRLADLRRRDGDDSAIKVCAMFDLPDKAVPFFERQFLKLARELAGERLPAATVCYVWDARLPAGTVVENPFSRRVRSIVLQGASEPLHAWRAERRDLAADFLRLFGDEATEVPPLRAVAIGADADNTHSHSLAHIADLALQ